MTGDAAQVRTAAWSLAEQAIVSLGSFLLNIQLARALPASEYGVFALVFSCVLLFQQCGLALLYFPMCQRISAAGGGRDARLVSITMTLFAAGNLVVSAALAGLAVVVGRGDVALAAAAFSLFWQVQDALRRCLVAEARHGAAMLGDAVTYAGQSLAIALLVDKGMPALSAVLTWMAIAGAAGGLMQLWHLGLPAPGFSGAPQLVRAYLRSGLWGMTGGLLINLRVQILPWVLGLLHGTAATAAFQAALNIGNLTNPLLFALCNTITLTGMNKRVRQGNRAAWTAARYYMLIGVPFIIAYCAAVFAAPTLVLSLFYGPQSVYLADALAVRVIMLSIVLNYLADACSAFLYGLDGGRMTTGIAMLGLGSVAVAAVMVWPWAVVGAALAMLFANMARLLACYRYVGSSLAAPTPLEPLNSDAQSARSDA